MRYEHSFVFWSHLKHQRLKGMGYLCYNLFGNMVTLLPQFLRGENIPSELGL